MERWKTPRSLETKAETPSQYAEASGKDDGSEVESAEDSEVQSADDAGEEDGDDAERRSETTLEKKWKKRSERPLKSRPLWFQRNRRVQPGRASSDSPRLGRQEVERFEEARP